MDDDEEINLLTHRGKPLLEDDFHDDIARSDDEYDGNTKDEKDRNKGIITADMVKAMNFGGGDEDEDTKKTREERLEEIMMKSKAYRLHHQEIREANDDAI